MRRNRQQKKNKASQLASTSKSTERKLRKSQARAEKYKNQQERVMPNYISQRELSSIKYQMQPILDQANKQIELIQASGYTSYALDRLEHEGNGEAYFDISEITNREDLIAILTKARVFLADKGSTVEGARLDTALIYGEQYRGKFGNNYNNAENNFEHFDVESIDKETAERVFSNYRRIEEHRATEIVNDGAYGSENLIIAMYDAEVRGYDSFEYGEDLLDSFMKTKETSWSSVENEFEDTTAISGIIEDNITGGNLW